MRSRAPPFHFIYIIRLFNALTLRTFFQPDEFFQSLEPAWQLAFGQQSGAWLTWEWHHQLRSSLHPMLFSAFYKLVAKSCDFFPGSANDALRTAAMLSAPKVLQAFIAAVGDYYTYRLAVKFYGPSSDASFAAIVLQLVSPWQWYVSTRTFSNSLETTLTVVALAKFPWEALADKGAGAAAEQKGVPSSMSRLKSLRICLCLAALAIVLRPTNVLVWAPIGLAALARMRRSDILILVREAILCGSFILLLSIAADRWYFGFWTFPPWRWLTFNVSKSLAVFYGRNPWHYYLLQGVPLLCTTSLPFALLGLYRSALPSNSSPITLRVISWTVLTTVLVLSLISHKEVRFIYPLLPTLNVLAAPHVADFFATKPTATSKSKRPKSRPRHTPYMFIALALNGLLASYLASYHQPAPLTVLHFLRGEYVRIHQPTSMFSSPPPSQADRPREHELFALFLMPCHSTPWRSHLIYPSLNAYALTCEPPLHTEPNTPERDLYRDEADRFYDDPLGFLNSELFAASSDFALPRYIVGFEGIEPWLDEFANGARGKEMGLEPRRIWEGFNGLFNEDWRRAGKIVVWDTGRYASD